ncbi:MAG: EamA family transporter [Bacteroidetes bacterium]|nr:EamA family transporter [Bacteroidota bacterium]
MRSQSRAYFFALAAILCWSTVASAFKLTLGEIGVGELLLVSTWTSLAVLVLIAAAQKKLTAIRAWPSTEWRHSALLGILNPFLYYLVLFRAYDLLPAQEAQPLNYTWPIILVLLSALILRQRLRWYSAIAMTASFAGVIVISTRGDLASLKFTSVEGVVLAVGSSLLWALYWIFNMRSGAEQILKLMANFIFGGIYVGIAYLFLPGKEPLTIIGTLGAMYVGVFEMGLTFVFWLQALKLSSSTDRVSNLVYLSPFLSLIVIHFVVGEAIFLSTVTGLVLIVSGIIMQKGGEYWIDGETV